MIYFIPEKKNNQYAFRKKPMRLENVGKLEGIIVAEEPELHFQNKTKVNLKGNMWVIF